MPARTESLCTVLLWVQRIGVFVDLFVGAWEWDHLQEALEEKLKNSIAVAQLMERIRSLIGRDRVKSLTFTITSLPLLQYTHTWHKNHMLVLLFDLVWILQCVRSHSPPRQQRLNIFNVSDPLFHGINTCFGSCRLTAPLISEALFRNGAVIMWL